MVEKVVFIYSRPPFPPLPPSSPDNSDYKDDEDDEESCEKFVVFAIDNCRRTAKPILVEPEYLPVFYENNWNERFSSSNGDTVFEGRINQFLREFPIMISDETYVVIMRSKEWLQKMGVEMKEGPGFKWDPFEMCYTEVSQPDSENYGWNEQLQEYGELCEHESGSFKPNWNNWVTFPERDHDAAKLLFSHKGGKYSTHECLCDCWGIFNPTNPDEVEEHSFEGGVRRCDDTMEFGR